MTQDTKRKLILPLLILFALIVIAILFVSHHAARTHAADQSHVDALNDALKNGLLTKFQYDAEIRKLGHHNSPEARP